MQVQLTQEFKQDAETIFTSYIDRSFVNKKLSTLGSRNIEFELTSKTADGITINITHEVPSDVPRTLQKFISPWSKVVQAEIWKANPDGTFESYADVEVSGLPANIVGEFVITPKAEGGSTLVATTTVTCSIPLVGKILAKFVAEESNKSLAEEFAYIEEHV